MASSNSIPSKVDFKVKQGDTFKRVITFFEPDGTTPSDVTGYVPKMIFDDTTITPLTVGVGLTWGTGGDAHKLYLNVAWPYDTKVKYEFEITYASGDVETKFEGTISVVKEIPETA